MPVYVYRCVCCQRTREIYRHVDDRDTPVLCSCGGTPHRVYQPTNFNMSGATSDDPITKFQFEHLAHD